MPSVSKKQHDFMQIVKHRRDFAAKVGVSQKVAREFIAEDEKAGRYPPKKKSKGKPR